MRSCDALIVGGGPAGSTTARELRRAGLDIVVMDKAEFPRHKVCAGWITPAVLESLELSPDDYRQQGRTLQPIRAFRVAGIGKAVHRLPYRETISYGIRRCELDDYLLRRSGARLALGEPLESLAWDGKRWLANGEIEAPVIIGAGGHFCPVARHLTADRARSENVVIAQEIEIPVDSTCAIDGDCPELFFADDLSGYGWCFRKGDYLNVGLGKIGGGNLPAQVKAFVNELQNQGRIPRDLGRFQGHAYLLHGHGERPLVSDGVMLVGDAAGLAYPTSGEGIRPAIESGMMAAQVVLECDGDYRAGNLREYARRVALRFGRGKTFASAPRSWKRALGRGLFWSRWLVRRWLIDNLFLHRQIPPLRPTSATAGAAPTSRGRARAAPRLAQR